MTMQKIVASSKQEKTLFTYVYTRIYHNVFENFFSKIHKIVVGLRNNA